MKIAICLHHFLPDRIGGTELYTFNLAKQLLKQNIEVIILVPNLGNSAMDEYFYEGIRTIRYAENSIENRRMIQGKTKPDGLELFAEIISREAPAIVHFHELSPGRGPSIFHAEIVYELKIPIVITFHVPYYTCFRGSLIYKDIEKCNGKIYINKCTSCIYHQKNIKGIQASLLLKLAMGLYNINMNATVLNNSVGTAIGFPFVVNKIKTDLERYSFLAEKIVVIADWYKQVLERNQVPPEKIVLMKQGLTNLKIGSLISPPLKLPLRVVYMGRITHLKGLHLLIDAIMQLAPQIICLDIYGLATADAYVKACKEKTDTVENIHWKGIVLPESVIPTLSKNHLLCLPSAFEMSPLVIQEAFAARIPVLASDVPGNAEQIKDGENGWLFRTNDTEDLKNKLMELSGDLTLIDNAQKHMPELKGFDEVGNGHLSLYSSIIERYKN